MKHQSLLLKAKFLLQVVYKAKDLTKLMKKKESYEGKLERYYDFTSRNPAAPRPTIKVHIHSMQRQCKYHEWLLLEAVLCSTVLEHSVLPKQIVISRSEVLRFQMKILNLFQMILTGMFKTRNFLLLTLEWFECLFRKLGIICAARNWMPLNTTKVKLTDWKRRYIYALRCSFFESICIQQLNFLKVYCNRPFSKGSHSLIGLKLHIIISNLNFVMSWILARGAVVDESDGATVIPGTNMWTKYYLDPCPLDAWKFNV